MNVKIHIIIMLLFLSLSLFPLEYSLTYFNGFSYANTTLYGDSAWDDLDQLNMLTGILISQPIEKKKEYGRQLRLAFNYPVWAQVRQLDGTDYTLLDPNDDYCYGANFFIGLELPSKKSNELFSVTKVIGPVVDFQSLTDSMILKMGVEGGFEGEFSLSENWSYHMGLSLSYYLSGIHTVGDSSRYELYLKRGWAVAVYPGFRYSF
jgi:hypothetical protein